MLLARALARGAHARTQAVAPRAHRRRLLPPDRARLHGDARAGSMQAPLGDRASPARVVLGSCVPIAKRCPPASCPRTTRRSSRSTSARPRARASTATRLIAERIAERRAPLPGVAHTLLTVGEGDAAGARTSPRSTSTLVDPEQRAARPVAAHGSASRNEIVAKQPPELRVNVGRGRRRSPSAAQSSREHPDASSSGPDLDAARASTRTQITEGAPEDARRRRRRQHARRRQARGPRHHRSRSRRRPRRQVADVADTLQLLVGGLKVSTYAEARRGVRRPHARRRAATAPTPTSLALMTVPSSQARRGAALVASSRWTRRRRPSRSIASAGSGRSRSSRTPPRASATATVSRRIDKISPSCTAAGLLRLQPAGQLEEHGRDGGGLRRSSSGWRSSSCT